MFRLKYGRVQANLPSKRPDRRGRKGNAKVPRRIAVDGSGHGPVLCGHRQLGFVIETQTRTPKPSGEFWSWLKGKIDGEGQCYHCTKRRANEIKEKRYSVPRGCLAITTAFQTVGGAVAWVVSKLAKSFLHYCNLALMEFGIMKTTRRLFLELNQRFFFFFFIIAPSIECPPRSAWTSKVECCCFPHKVYFDIRSRMLYFPRYKCLFSHRFWILMLFLKRWHRPVLSQTRERAGRSSLAPTVPQVRLAWRSSQCSFQKKFGDLRIKSTQTGGHDTTTETLEPPQSHGKTCQVRCGCTFSGLFGQNNLSCRQLVPLAAYGTMTSIVRFSLFPWFIVGFFFFFHPSSKVPFIGAVRIASPLHW